MNRFCRCCSFISIAILSGCNGLLDVSNPTLIQESDIANASGANARRLAAVAEFHDGVALLSDNVGFFTDELMVDQRTTTVKSFSPEVYYDQRKSRELDDFLSGGQSPLDEHLDGWTQIITKAAIAIPAVRAYAPDSLRGDFLAQLYTIRGYAITQLAEDVCSGFPINDVVNNLPVFGKPMMTDSAFQLVLTQIDSAFKYFQDSARIRNLARMVKSRALLNLGRYSEAAAVAAEVSQDFVFLNDGILSEGAGFNVFARQSYKPSDWPFYVHVYAVGEREGGNGMPFVSANDPRVPTVFGGTRKSSPTDSLYAQTKYQAINVSLVVTSGVEAQLIRAEAALHSNDPSWLTILNALRATAITPALSPLTDPRTPAARVDLVYRERAFWLFLTGRRLGDLRRLVRNYNRNPETVFPTGTYPIGGTLYGTGTAIPFNHYNHQRFNPHLTSGCTTY